MRYCSVYNCSGLATPNTDFCARHAQTSDALFAGLTAQLAAERNGRWAMEETYKGACIQRDRYAEALREIRETKANYPGDGSVALMLIDDIARAALAQAPKAGGGEGLT